MGTSRIWRDLALTASSFDACLEHLLNGLRDTAGATHVLAIAPSWATWRGPRGGVAPWSAVLERYSPRVHAAQFVASREELVGNEPSLASMGVPACSVAIVPVLRARDAWGGLAAVFDRARVLMPDERARLETFAEEATAVLERAHLLYELERQHRVWQLIADTGNALASSLDYEATLERVVRLVIPQFADWAAVDLVIEDGSYERVAVACSNPVKHALAQQLKRRPYKPVPEVSGASNVIARARPQLVPVLTDEILQASARDELHLGIMRALALRSYVSAPLVVGERVIGALSLGSESRAYDERDLEIALELARRAATAIENARLFTIEQRTARRLRKLQDVTLGMAGARTPDEIAEVATRLGAEAVDASSAGMWLRLPDGSLGLAGVFAVPEEIVRPFTTVAADHPMHLAEVARTGEAVWVETPADYARVAHDGYAHAKAADRLRAHAMLPVVIDGAVIAVLAFGYTQTHYFSPDERTYLRALAEAAGQALDRAQLFIREQAAHERAEAASRAKDEFLAMLGHELRNPLAPIVTALDLMKLANAGHLGREAVVIERQVAHLTHLVDDLLDIARITRGAVVLRRQPTHLADAAKQAIEAVSVMYEDRVHALHVDIDDTLTLDADRARLVQVLTNLLTNAGKYTPAGGKISLLATRRGDRAVIRVVDNGKGMTPGLLARVFDLFVQGERSADRGEGGLGLGLSIVKNLVRMHGATISANSNGLGEGSEFTLEWPLATEAIAVPTRQRARIHAATTTPLKILVVDDNLDAADMLCEVLRDRGHEVVVAHDGAMALAAVQDAQPQIAILDIGLPVMDGYELAEQIRKRPELANVHLIALTGFGQPADIERAKRAGFDQHCVKPLDLRALDDILARN